MPKDIKIKEKDSHFIRKLDRTVAFTSRVKNSMSEQYNKVKQETSKEENIETSNASNYATTKIMRTGDRGARETAYVISGVSKNAYDKVKMKLSEKKVNKNTGLTSEIKSYQKKKLIKEKEGFENIKKPNYKDAGIKYNNNSLKIKTRDTLKNMQNAAKNGIKIHTSNDLMKKSKLQKIKQNSIRIKNIAQKVGKVAINVTKKLAQRTKRNGNVNSFWRWICCNNNYHSFNYCRYVWFSIWFLIF